ACQVRRRPIDDAQRSHRIAQVPQCHVPQIIDGKLFVWSLLRDDEEVNLGPGASEPQRRLRVKAVGLQLAPLASRGEELEVQFLEDQRASTGRARSSKE